MPPPEDALASANSQPGRKRDGGNSPVMVPKSKRPRYVLYACNECKRRKVKCDGEQPCQRCVNSIVRCSYYRTSRTTDGIPTQMPNSHALSGRDETPSVHNEAFDQISAQMHTVLERVDTLSARLNAISPPVASQTPQQPVVSMPTLHNPADLNSPHGTRPEALNSSASSHSLPSRLNEDPDTLSPEYHGPTSSEFTFEVANESLAKIGIGCAMSSNKPTGPMSFSSISRNPAADRSLLQNLLARDPLLRVARADALRWIEMYHNTVGAMYPITNASCLTPKLQLLLDASDLARGRRAQDSLSRLIELMFSVDTQIIKIQLGIGIITERGLSGTDSATELVRSVLDLLDDSLMGVEGLSGVRILVLTALFHYSLDEELKASRCSCLASRRCLEMGLHRRDTLMKYFPEEAERKEALRIFWSVFTLDRRSSLGLGVPFVIQDSLVDPGLVPLEFDHDYLRCMISFAKLSGKAWQMSNDFSSKEPDVMREEIDYLDYKVVQWQKQIPATLRYCHGLTKISQPTSTDADASRQFYLSVVLYIRSNQLRNVIYRPLLQSISRIKSDPARTTTALNITRASFQAFADLYATTNLLQTHATFFKHFIISSLGNLLLIVVHTTTEYWNETRDMFQLASMLLRRLSVQSGTVSRVWDRLKGVEDLQTQISMARRLKADAQQQNLNYNGGSLGTRDEDIPSNALDNICNVGELGGGEGFMLFDSQIRDEFAGLFDSNFSTGDLNDYISLDTLG